MSGYAGPADATLGWSRPTAVRAGVRSATQNGVPMIVIGIDPGTASTGYGVVESAGSGLRSVSAGVIETRAGTALEHRLAKIHGRVGDLLDQSLPAAVAIEELYFGANVRTAFAVVQARGVVLLAAGERGIASRSYTPQQVKGAVCGHGRAGKDQVARMVARLLGLSEPPSPDHAADALAVARGDPVVVDTGGVGYRLAVSAETLRHVPAVGKSVALHSHLVVRDD